jgi:hypothetical protein
VDPYFAGSIQLGIKNSLPDIFPLFLGKKVFSPFDHHIQL